MILPAINAKTIEEAKEQFNKLKDTGATMLHLDVVDGKFAPNVTWGTPQEFKVLKENEWSELEFEIHLMIVNPEFQVGDWFKSGAKRVVVHIETISDLEVITDVAKEHDGEVLLSFSPEISIEKFEHYKNTVSKVQVLAVSPGKMGQSFDIHSIEKIIFLKTNFPDVTIEVDGGINLETARACKEAGAEEFVSASYILNNSSPKEAYDNLQKELL